MSHHKNRHKPRRKAAASPRKGSGSKGGTRKAGQGPAANVFSGNGHAPPDPAQFGARQKARRTMSSLAATATAPLRPEIPSTAEPEAMANPTSGKAHITATLQDTSPMPPKLPSKLPLPPSSDATTPGKPDRPSPRPEAEAASRPMPPRPMATPGFPPPQLAKIPPASPALPRPRMVAPAPQARNSAPAPRPAAPVVVPDAGVRALPLPQRDEPLTRDAPPPRLAQGTDAPLPRDRALAKQGAGLLGALNGWLRATGQRLMSGFMVKKSRRPAAPASLRERVELTQLRAENRRLRSQLEDAADPRHPAAALSLRERDGIRD